MATSPSEEKINSLHENSLALSPIEISLKKSFREDCNHCLNFIIGISKLGNLSCVYKNHPERARFTIKAVRIWRFVWYADFKEVSVNQCNNLGNILCKLYQNTEAPVLGHVDECTDLSTSHARSVRNLNENKTIIQT